MLYRFLKVVSVKKKVNLYQHKKLQKIHEQLSTKMESKAEEEELALKEMDETLKKLEKKLETKN